MALSGISRFLSLSVLGVAALSLAACGGGSEDTAASGSLSGEPIAKIEAPAGQNWSETFTATDAGGYLMGNPDAPIKLVEYGALSCSHCADFAEQSFAELRDDYIASGRVSYELRFFPLNIYDVPATLLATCSGTETTVPLSEAFWAEQPAFFEKAQSAGQGEFEAASKLPPEQRFGKLGELFGMVDFVTSRGISRDQAMACLADNAKAEQIVSRANEQGQQYDITGTPTFLINGQKEGIGTWPEIDSKLQALGAR
jgi:protein-disulfide isomerase